MKNHEEILRQGTTRLHIDLQEGRASRLLQYCMELHKWNRKINLIAKKTAIDESLEKHFLDSLTLLPIIDKYSDGEASLLDIGAGAGFPGLVLKIANPGLTVTLLEPRRKRATFLRHIIRMLRLENVEVISGRVEDENLLSKSRFFSFITSRAMAEPAVLLEMIKHLLKPGTYIILMQSRARPRQWFHGHMQKEYELVESKTFHLPFSASRRQITLLKSIADQTIIS